jgi:hypothetical protein
MSRTLLSRVMGSVSVLGLAASLMLVLGAATAQASTGTRLTPSLGSSLGLAGPMVTPATEEPALAEVITEPASSVKVTTAGLNGKLNPEGTANYYFEYCPNATPGTCRPPGSSESLKTGPVSISGTSLQSVGPEPLSGLLPQTTYHYWLVASNGRGALHGEEETFTTGALLAPSEVVAEPASQIRTTSAELNGMLNPGGSASYYFEYCPAAAPGTCAAKTAEGGPLTGESQQPTPAARIEGLLPHTTYHYRLTATNAGGTVHSSEATFTTEALHAPTISGESFTNVGSGSAQLSAQIDPNESLTSYYFEYGTSTAYGSSTPAVNLGDGESALPAPVQLNGLAAGVEYHFRVVAVNEAGTERGADTIFSTLPASILGLPDERVYERVSPAEDKNANVYIPNVLGTSLPLAEGIPTERPFKAAVGGNAVAYVGDPTSGGTGSSGAQGGNEYLATRSASGGWHQVNIQPPGRLGVEYQDFSKDLSVGIFRVSPQTVFESELPPLTPESPNESYQDMYKHNLESESYDPFFTKSTVFHLPTNEIANAYVGASDDLSQLLFESDDALTGNAENPGEENLYDSVGGRLSLINVLPNGTSEANATFGAPCTTQTQDCRGIGHNFSAEADFDHVMSADGSRVFWTDLNTGDLYVRENPTQPQSPLDSSGDCLVSNDACTVQVDAAVGGGGRFWAASVDGSKVFFTKAKSGADVNEYEYENGELYEYDLENGQTTNLTPGVDVAGVLGSSEDGEYIYYVDSSYNLNLWHDGTSTFIATLASGDGGKRGGNGTPIAPYGGKGGGSVGDWNASLGQRTAEVTPDGLGLVFMSNQSLRAAGYPNGYDNEGREEVYVYEAQAGGRLFCVSCSPSGESPPSGSYGAAAFLPVSWGATYQPEGLISDDGSRVFFDSAEPLVPQDTNDKLDVYEWERDGAGSCQESKGCVYLLSGGQSGSASWLIGASASGDDVFVISRAPLVPGDPYDSYAVYDARVGGVQPPALPACTGTGCQGVPTAPPIFATPASVTFDGVGNFPPSVVMAGSGKPKSKASTKRKSKAKAKSLTRAQQLAHALKACRKKRKEDRVACERQARKRYAAASRLRRDDRSAAREGGR